MKVILKKVQKLEEENIKNSAKLQMLKDADVDYLARRPVEPSV
jgi:hypothetical protein